MFTPCQVEPLQHELKKEEQEEEKDETHIKAEYYLAQIKAVERPFSNQAHITCSQSNIPFFGKNISSPTFFPCGLLRKSNKKQKLVGSL